MTYSKAWPARLMLPDRLFGLAAAVIRPSPKTTPDEWARANRTYPSTSGIPGPRNPGLTPYVIGIERALASGKYRRVVAVTSAQLGKTDLALDVMGHRLDQRPAPILYVGPTKQFVTEQFEPRVMALLDQAPSLKAKVLRGKRMTKTRKVVAGVPVRLAHGGSSSALKSDPAALAIVDEYDEMLKNISGRGDPLGLVEARGDTYADFTTLICSTPSLGAVEVERDQVSGLQFWKPAPSDDLESAIWKRWQEGTRYHWAWQCPHCRGWFIPRFNLLMWPEKATPAEALRSAHLVCPCDGCGGVIEEADKKGMNDRGQFVAPGQSIDDDGNVTGDPPESTTASFWVSGLASPFVTFGQRAHKFLAAVRAGDRDEQQTAINAGFGELWAPAGGEAPEALEVARLRMPYHMGDLPDGAVVLTAGIDVQKNRLVYVIRGWGPRSTSWLIQHGELWGNTADTQVWDDLDDLLEQPINDLRIRLAVIDSGFRPNKTDAGPEHTVYEFCRRHQRNTMPSKGFETLSSPVIVSKIEVSPSGGKAKYGLELLRINTDWCKLWVHERIRWPQDQPGAFHLPEDVNDEYCKQLVSESRLKKPSGRATWVRKRKDNHALDCEAMAYAGAYLLNVQRIPDGAVRRVAQEQQTGAAPMMQRQAAQVARSNYLSR